MTAGGEGQAGDRNTTTVVRSPTQSAPHCVDGPRTTQVHSSSRHDQSYVASLCPHASLWPGLCSHLFGGGRHPGGRRSPGPPIPLGRKGGQEVREQEHRKRRPRGLEAGLGQSQPRGLRGTNLGRRTVGVEDSFALTGAVPAVPLRSAVGTQRMLGERLNDSAPGKRVGTTG